MLPQFVGEAIAELRQLEEHVDRRAPRRGGDASWPSAPQIHVLAQRRAFPVACYLAYALNQLELQAHLLDGVGGMLGEFAHTIRPGDVLLVVSFRNYTPAVVETALASRARGVSVIAITDSALSPLKPAADVCFELGDDSTRPFRSLVAPLCLAQALVVSTGHHLAAGGDGGARAGNGAATMSERRRDAAMSAARRSTSSAWAAPRSTCTASRSAAASRTCARSRSTSAARRPTPPSAWRASA